MTDLTTGDIVGTSIMVLWVTMMVLAIVALVLQVIVLGDCVLGDGFRRLAYEIGPFAYEHACGMD